MKSSDTHLDSKNNFDLIRFVLASIVVLVHAQAVSGNSTLPFTTYLSGSVAVQGFFVISGLLIVQSYERSSNLGRYALKRIRRIYPAYIFIILASAGLGLFLTTRTVSDYFGISLLRYLFFNLVFLNFAQDSLPGVFSQNPVMDVVNGALWTLKVEVAFYIIAPILVSLIRRFRAVPVLLTMYFGGACVYLIGEYLAAKTGQFLFHQIGRQLPGQAAYFAVGVAAYYISKNRRLPPLPMFGVGLALFILSATAGGDLAYAIIRPLALGLIVLGLGYAYYLGNFGKYGDFSYGIYIVHFPIIQTLLHFGFFQDPLIYTLASYGLALGASIGLWHGIEKHFLRSSSHYRRVEHDVSSLESPTG